MSASPSVAKRGALTGAALTAEVFDSSPSLLRPNRGGSSTGLQQYFSRPEAAELVAAVNGRDLPTLDLTAGDGSLLAGVDVDARFGVEIDADQVAAGDYQAIQGDAQLAYPLMRLLGTRFERIACNPPFGLDWSVSGTTETSTVATWRMAMGLLDTYGAGAFIAGRDRFLRSILDRDDAAGVYTLVELDDLFDGVSLPCVLAFFVAPENVSADVGSGPLRLAAKREELPGLAQQIIAEREQVAGFVAEYPSRRRLSHRDCFAKVDGELQRRRGESASSRQRFDLALRGNRVSALPSPFARIALSEHDRLREVERLHRQPVTYFALNPREWNQLRELAEKDVLTLDPALVIAVDAAIDEAERAVCPLYAVRPQQRLAFLDDLDSIRCVVADAERGFEAGESYALATSSHVNVGSEDRPHLKRDGDYEIRRYETEAKVLRIEIGSELFSESAADVDYLLKHFEIPDPGDLATHYPEEAEAARAVLRDLAVENDFTYFTSDTEEWQLEDLFAAGDEQAGVAEERLADLDLALVELGVDHEDAGGGDGEVVDVRAPAGNVAVVEDEYLGAGLRQVRREHFLASGTGLPGGLACRCGPSSQQELADAGMALVGIGLASCSVPFVLAAGAASRSAQVKLGSFCHCLMIGCGTTRLNKRAFRCELEQCWTRSGGSGTM